MKKLIFAALLAVTATAAAAQTQCTATTKKGTQCTRHAQTGSAYCKQHDPHAVKCAATTKAGKPCQLLPTKGGQFCHVHSK